MTDAEFFEVTNSLDIYAEFKEENLNRMNEKQLKEMYNAFSCRSDLVFYNAKYKAKCRKAMKYIDKLLKKIQKEK